MEILSIIGKIIIALVVLIVILSIALVEYNGDEWNDDDGPQMG